MTQPTLMCAVCNAEPALGVASSRLGAFSVAYGRSCLEKGLEPKWAVIGTIFCVGTERKQFNEPTLNLIDRCLEFYGMTWEQAVEEAAKIQPPVEEEPT